MKLGLLPVTAYLSLCRAAILTDLPDVLKSISSSIFPDLKVIAQDIYEHPEVSKSEFRAHHDVFNYFTVAEPDIWKVMAHAFNEPTPWVLDFVNIPDGTMFHSEDDIPVISFLAEYDTLLSLGHACGHHLIALNGLAAASISRQALIDLNIPGGIRVIGCPDEEDTAGKQRLEVAGHLAADTHFEVDKKAYEALTKITDLAGTLPGNSSTASPVENVGMCTSNVVQTQIQFGVAGLSLRDVKNIVDGILDATYVGVNYTTREVVNDPSGAALTIDGPGGRSSESLKSPLRLSIETFRHLSTSKGDAVSFFLPENTTVMQLDITVSVQTQYTSDQDAVTVAAKDVIADSASKISTDLQYHALKVDPVIGNMFLDLMHGNDYGEPDWLISTVAPAATDASFVQRAELDSATHALIGARMQENDVKNQAQAKDSLGSYMLAVFSVVLSAFASREEADDNQVELRTEHHVPVTCFRKPWPKLASQWQPPAIDDNMADEDAPTQAPQDGAASDISQRLTASEAAPATPAAAAASPAPSSASSQARPHYTPQFSATTEMILKRIRAGSGGLSSAISSASTAGTINKRTYEDAKRRLVMNMNTSIAIPMPASAPDPPPRSQPRSTPVLAPARAPVLPKVEIKPESSMPAPRPRGRPPKLDKKGKAPRGAKRKRGQDDDEGSSVLSEPPDSGEDDEYQEATPTMTKSGRQVLKPPQFNPATESSAGKRKHYGKRTAEQALCKVCTRGLSPANNQIVFCDGCNLCWHQMCHDPYIDDEFVSDESRSWFCRSCLAKREKHLAKKKSVDGYKGMSWASKSADQRRAYLSGLLQGQLVNLVMYSLELHPDLPVFPEGNAPRRGRPPAGSQVMALPASPGPIHYTQSVSTPNGSSASGSHKNGKMDRTARERSEDIPPAWPHVGSGVLAGINLNEDDFEDNNDFESFSVATYDTKTGKKIVENGMPSSGQEAAAS
ncbi:phd finger domain-containing protein [Seiridium cupressi]